MTLGPQLCRLASLGSAALSAEPVVGLPAGRLGRELGDLLQHRNGFVAFDAALMVRGSGTGPDNLAAWNAEAGWRAHYAGMADDIFFFAEDVFGGQFGLLDEAVLAFDPETADRRVMASNLDDWAQQLLVDVGLLTGHPLGWAWQQRRGPLPLGKRLIPGIPFVLGGDYDVPNLSALDAKEGMQVRGELAVQIRDLPDGAQVSYRITR